MLRTLGYLCPDRCVPHFRLKQPPEFGFAMRQNSRKSGWHWVAIGKGQVWDGALPNPLTLVHYETAISDYPFDGEGRITSYLPVTRS